MFRPPDQDVGRNTADKTVDVQTCANAGDGLKHLALLDVRATLRAYAHLDGIIIDDIVTH